jgi:hypothetical protein
MPKHSLKIAVLLAALSVAPASAGNQLTSGAGHDRSACPQKNARQGTTAAPAASSPRKAAPTTVIVKSSGFFAPGPRFMSDLTL